MSNVTLTEQNTTAAVYSVEEMSWPQEVPAKAKSKFSEEYDIPYSNCRAQTVNYLGATFVIVGAIE